MQSNRNLVRKLVESVISNAYRFRYGVEGNALSFVCFETTRPITLAQLTALAKALGTEKINIFTGERGSPDLSEVTPGEPGVDGYIEVLF